MSFADHRLSCHPHLAADPGAEGAGARRCRDRADDSHRHARARPRPAGAVALHPLSRRCRAEDRRKAGRLAEKREGPLPEGRRKQELARFSRAPLVIGVISSPKENPKIPQWEMFLSGGAAAMNLVHRRQRAGLRHQLDHQLVFRHARRAARILGLAPHERVVGFVHIGTYAGSVAGAAAARCRRSSFPTIRGPWEG